MDKKLTRLVLPVVAAAIIASASINKRTTVYNDDSTIIQNNVIEEDCEDCSDQVQKNTIIAEISEKHVHKKHRKPLLKRIEAFMCGYQDHIDVDGGYMPFDKRDCHKPGCTCFSSVEEREYRKLRNFLWAPNDGICTPRQSQSFFIYMSRPSKSSLLYRDSGKSYKDW